MRNVAVIVMGIVALGTIAGVHADENDVVISEVAINPSGSDSGKEFIELYNPSSENIDVSGWDLDADALPYFTFPADTVIGAKRTLTIKLRQDGVSTMDTLFTGASFGSSNLRSSRGMVALFKSTAHLQQDIIDYVQYGGFGEVHENIAVAAGKWMAGMYVSFLDTEGYSIQRSCISHTMECWIYEAENPGTTLITEVSTQPTLELYINNAQYLASSFIAGEAVPLSITLKNAGSGALLFARQDGISLSITNNTATFIPDAHGEYHIEYGIEQDGVQTDPLNFVYTYQDMDEAPESQVRLTVSEVLFLGNTEQPDFVELYVVSAPGEGEQLMGYAVQIDESLYDLSGIQVKPGDYIVLQFGSGGFQSSLENIHVLTVPTASGLVSTTEQVQVLDRDQRLIAGICWQGSSISSNETAEHAFFTTYNHEVWSGDCISSIGLHTGESIHLKQAQLENGTAKDNYKIIAHPTPGASEIIPNEPPQGVIIIQGNGSRTGTVPFAMNVTGESSTDDNGIAEYLWDFGDGYVYIGENPPAHIYTSPGEFLLSLTVRDIEGLEHQTTQTVIVAPKTVEMNTSESHTECKPSTEAKSVRINEILPNPKGSDGGKEWVELFNPTQAAVSLCGLYLDDMEGGSAPYLFTNEQIPAQGYLVLYDNQTKLSMGNTQDAIRILDADRATTIQQVTYEDPPESKSYSIFIP